MMVHHEDRGGDQVTASEINEAYERLQSTESFRQFKTEFLRSRRSRVESLEATVLESERAKRILTTTTERLVLEKFLPRKEDLLRLEDVGERKLFAFNFLESVAVRRWDVPNLGFYPPIQIEQGKDGLTIVDLFRHNLKSGETAEHTPWVYGPKEGCKGVHYCFMARETTRRLVPKIRIVGSILPSCFGHQMTDRSEAREKFKLLLPSRQFSKPELDNIRNGFSWEQIKGYAPAWSNIATGNSVLVALDETTGLFQFIGTLRDWSPRDVDSV